MRTILVLIAVTLCTSITAAAAGVPLREEQYRAKYGRYTPAFEARRDYEARAASKHGRAFSAGSGTAQDASRPNGCCRNCCATPE